MVLFCIPCLVLLLYFLIASIFFPRYRTYIKDGWRCFIDKLMRRKCAASFDNRMRLAFSMWLTSHHMPGLGRFFHSERNFKLTFTILGIVFTILSIYLFLLFIHFQINPPCSDDVCKI
ncbi:MAG: hypothetical protein NT129_02550 [Candidatus Aenigmarchaeota archaeon]|nr:hypothetical protein [Candidatus Aenigmarchaeota archaeon]